MRNLIQIQVGSTSVTLPVTLYDAFTGLPKASVTLANLDLSYTQVLNDGEISDHVNANIAALSAKDDAWNDNSTWEVGDTGNGLGVYRIDFPDGVFAAGAKTAKVVIWDAASDTILPATVDFQLTADDPYTSKLGTPVSLDSGTATIAGMLTKMSDDDDGGTFDAETDSLNKIQTSVSAGFPTAVTQDSGNITTGTQTGAGRVADTELDNGTYWQIAATTADGDGFGLSVDITFAVGLDRTAATVHVNAKEDMVGVVLVWAYNYLTSAYEQISDAGTGISGTSDTDYTYILLPRHQQVSDGEVNIRFTSTSTNAAKYLYLDQVFIGAVGVSGSSPAEIAQAVWEQELGTIHATNQDSAAHILADMSLVRGEVTGDTNLSFTLDANAVGTVDAYVGSTIIVEDMTDDHYEARRIISYTAGRVVTVDKAFSFVPASGDHYDILAGGYGDIDMTQLLTTTGITAGGTWTLAEIFKVLAAAAFGDWKDKSGAEGTYEIFDAEDGTTAIAELTPAEDSPYKTVSITV